MSEFKKPKGAAITASAKPESNIPLIEAGSYGARCFFMAHIGTIQDEYQGKPITANKVRIAWQIPDERLEIERDGKKENLPRVIGKEYTLSLSDKSTLKKDLEAWRGKQFTKEELEAFDITNILGVECMLSVIVKESKSNAGKSYNVVSSVSKPPKGMKVGPVEGDMVLFSHGIEDNDEFLAAFKLLPEFVQDSVVTSKEWKERGLERPAKDPKATPAVNSAETPADEVSEAHDGEAGEEEPPF